MTAITTSTQYLQINAKRKFNKYGFEKPTLSNPKVIDNSSL